MYTLREPLGVCGQIVAWNTPLAMAASKIANALACGNTVVLKPSEIAPLSTLRLGELIVETDLPPGVVNIIPGPGATAGAALAAHPDVDKIAFVGSTAVGRQIVQASAVNLKRLTLELGGKSPNIIFPDADIEKAVEAAVWAFCRLSGQHCAAGTRLLVHASVQEEVAHEVARVAATYKVGSPFAPDTKMGPLVSSKQLDRVQSYIDAGRTEGAELEFGGSRVGSTGYFIQPTVFSGVSNEMKIAREEIFGPVLSIIPFADEADAIAKGNDTDYGLSAAVWTHDLGRAHRVAHSLQAGRVWINAYGEGDLVVPFGGYKQSGYGRENGPESIDDYTQSKAILMRY
jgi:acyl-CoA reductase-like NAD-dependent aldehyde dehydrogenase